jgi:valyl-tRNA synthetase
VLDTWFSSALWPFSTLGWPDDTDDLNTFYPTSVLITGFDILFFWVARMVMMGLKFMGSEPFRHVYIHALIRDEEGQKMSKSKGNVVDPLRMTEVYGTDAFRFTLAAYAAQGRDIKFSEKRVEGYKHFINKIWNASRFIFMNIREDEEIKQVREIQTLSLADRWILSRLSSVASEVNASLGEYRFNDAAGILYQFIWHEFCDWYLEMVKPGLYSDDAESRISAISTLIHVIENSLGLLHPFMPFITEEIWQQIPGKKGVESICLREYPSADHSISDPEAERKMGVIIDAISGIRSIRGELNISPSLEIRAVIRTQDGTADILNGHLLYLKKLARVGDIKIGDEIESPKNAASEIRALMEIFVPLKGIIDTDVEIERLQKDMKKHEAELSFIGKKLSNEGFIRKAPKAVVEESRDNYNELKDKINSIMASIEKLRRLHEEDS